MRHSLRTAAESAATLSAILLTYTILLIVIVPAVSKAEEDDYKVMAVPDEATTYTGHPILVNVLKNDYHKDGKTALVLTGITSDGTHGKCTIVGDIVTTSVSSISYNPDYGYSGYDKCGYKVCAADDYNECSFSTLSVVIAKQLEAEYNAVSMPTNDRRPIDGSEVTLADVVDPEDLLSEEVWEEVEQSIGPAIIDGMWESSIEFDLDFCSSDDEVLLTVELQTDEYGGDVSWELRKVITSTTLQRIKKGGFYTRYSYDRADVCVLPGMYTFIIFDEYGDGMCNHEAGMCGYYKLYLDGREVVNVSFYGKSNNHQINVGYDPTPAMTTRESEYLLAHNERRQKWHEMHNVQYVPLLWSPKLAEASSKWAVALLDACDSDDIEHEQGVREGENLAKNKGFEFENGSPSWGQLYPPENIVGRWVDREIGWNYPKNAHLTQALWRASKYLGCAESEKDYNGGKCRVQVCRYAKAGNCDMTRYNATVGENWLVPMLSDSSPCEPSCPEEGCY